MNNTTSLLILILFVVLSVGFLGSLDAQSASAEQNSAEETAEDRSLVKIEELIKQAKETEKAEETPQAEQRLEQRYRVDMLFGAQGVARIAVTEEGNSALAAFIRQLLDVREDVSERFPEDGISIDIRTICDPEEIGAEEDDELINALLQGKEQEFSQQQAGRGQFLRKRLARLRATRINSALQRHFSEARNDGAELRLMRADTQNISAEGTPLADTHVQQAQQEQTPARAPACRIVAIVSRKKRGPLTDQPVPLPPLDNILQKQPPQE